MSLHTPIETTGAPPPEGPQSNEGLSLARKITLVVVFVALLGVIVVGVISRRSGGDGVVAKVSPTTPAASLPKADQPPALVNTGEDWDTIIRSIVAYNDWLRVHPNAELLRNIWRPADVKQAPATPDFSDYRAKGWHYDPVPAPLSVEEVRLSSYPFPNTALVYIRFGVIPEYRLVDQTGKVMSDEPSQPGNAAQWTLRVDPGDGRWKIEKAERL